LIRIIILNETCESDHGSHFCIAILEFLRFIYFLILIKYDKILENDEEADSFYHIRRTTI